MNDKSTRTPKQMLELLVYSIKLSTEEAEKENSTTPDGLQLPQHNCPGSCQGS